MASPVELERLPYWGKGPEEDITKLPQGMEARVTKEGRVFFVNHEEKKTDWVHPTTKLKYRVDPYLPYGWQVFKDDDDALVFVDHLDGVSSRVDPRLLNRLAYDFPELYGIKSFPAIRHRFRPYVKAEAVLKGVELGRKVAIVTGGSSGIGFETARSLAAHGAKVILAGRNPHTANQAVNKIQAQHPAALVEYMELDLGSLNSVKLFADAFLTKNFRLDILVCNAGVFEPNFSLSADGLEMHFAVNHLGHFYLVQLLREALLDTAPSRIVVLSSEAHWYPTPVSSRLDMASIQHPSKESYSATAAYGASKLCNILFAQEFHRRWSGDGVACNAVHPGNLLPTKLMRKAGLLYQVGTTLARPFTNSVEQAAACVVFCAAHPRMESMSGLYLYRCDPVEPSLEAQRVSTARALWQLSEQIINSKTAHLH